MISAKDALTRLKEGNQRFVEGIRVPKSRYNEERRNQLLAGQNPFAIILGCSDSRVPAEMVFDQGLGDLFVIRVAGNIVAPSLVGSVEFAASRFGTPLVVVMGHSHCGAVSATIEELEMPNENRSPNLESIVKRIRPSVENLMDLNLPPEELKGRAIRANIRKSCDHLRHGSAILEDLLGKGELMIVGAEYSLESGKVDFFEQE